MRTIVNFFRCTNCGEHDVDLSGMCVRDGCPKEHDGYTEIRFIEPGSDGIIPLIGREGAWFPDETADRDRDDDG